MPAPLPDPVFMEAFPSYDGSGWVDVGRLLTFSEAVLHRLAGGSVVVCGDDHKTNKDLGWSVESGVGPASRVQLPHKGSAGPHALPHYHQLSRVPRGHTFYEVPPKLRARR